MATVDVIENGVCFTVFDYVAEAAEQVGVIHPSNDPRVWHLMEGKTWEDLELVEYVETVQPSGEDVAVYGLNVTDDDDRRANYRTWRERLRGVAFTQGEML